MQRHYAPQRKRQPAESPAFHGENAAGRVTGLSYTHEPLSASELAAGGAAVAAVALIVLLGVTFSQSPNQPPANPLPTSPLPATSPSTAAKAPELPDRAPTGIAGAQPKALTDGIAIRALESLRSGLLAKSRRANPDETKRPGALDFLVEAAPETIVEMRSPDIGGSPPPLIGPPDLFRTKRAVGDQPPKPTTEAPITEAPVPAPPASERNPSNHVDAIWIQTKLHDLGYFRGNASGAWGQASRDALRDFKTMNGLRQDDKWDQEAEKRLLSKQNVPASSTFIGGWAQSNEECQNIRSGSAPLVIRSRGAETDRVKCSFRSVKREVATTWRIQAACSAEGQSWNANVDLRLTGSNLNWSSERGSETYVRCLKP